MSYVVFDLDKTIADVTTVYYFLISLTLKEFMLEYNPHLACQFSDELEDQLARAYLIFVERITKEEESVKPLGILRPGMIEIMKQITQMDSIIKGVSIYSNNQYLPSLRLVRDIIHRSVGKPIIGSCVHWHHPLRSLDHLSHQLMTKTWPTLRSILIDQGAPPNLTRERVFFFDDQIHSPLQSALQDQYYRVPPYQMNSQLDRITEIYVKSLEEAKVNIYDLYLNLMDMLEGDQLEPTNFMMSDLIDLIHTASYQNASPRPSMPLQDRGIRIIKRALKDMKLQDRAIRGEPKRRTRKKSSSSRWNDSACWFYYLSFYCLFGHRNTRNNFRM